MNIEDPVSEFYFALPEHTALRFGIVALIAGERRQLWVNSEKQQQALFDKLLGDALKRKHKTLFEVQRVFARSNGTLLAALGEEPARVQWRQTVLRTMAPEDCIWREQRAVLELYSGRVLVTDQKKRFDPSQYEKWPRGNCLTELRPSAPVTSRGFWAKVIPARDDSAHYLVQSTEDLTLLRTECEVSEDLLESL